MTFARDVLARDGRRHSQRQCAKYGKQQVITHGPALPGRPTQPLRRLRQANGQSFSSRADTDSSCHRQFSKGHDLAGSPLIQIKGAVQAQWPLLPFLPACSRLDQKQPLASRKIAGAAARPTEWFGSRLRRRKPQSHQQHAKPGSDPPVIARLGGGKGERRPPEAPKATTTSWRPARPPEVHPRQLGAA